MDRTNMGRSSLKEEINRMGMFLLLIDKIRSEEADIEDPLGQGRRRLLGNERENSPWFWNEHNWGIERVVYLNCNGG